MALVSIVDDNGNITYELPTPSTYVGTTSTLVDSGRNTKGIVIGTVIIGDLSKIEMSWNYLTADQWAELVSHFKDADGTNFYLHIRYLNQDTNEFEIRDMYSNDLKTGGVFSNLDTNGKPKGYKNCKLNLIDVGTR